VKEQSIFTHAWVIFTCLSLTTASGAATSISSAQSRQAKETSCTISGWSKDTDIKGLNVHRSASAKSAIVGTLPAYYEDGQTGERYRTDFDIIGSLNGWLKITHSRDYPNSRPSRKTFDGTGWISGRLVGFSIQSTKAYAQPSEKARSSAEFGKDTYFYETAELISVVGCQNNFALVDYRLTAERTNAGELRTLSVQDPRRKKIRRAWFNHICPIIETSCEMEH
jgi:hypothetical protein